MRRGVIVGLVFVLAMLIAGAPVQAADKMPMGPAKLIAAPCHGLARTVNTAFKVTVEGLGKAGPFGLPFAAVAFVVDTAENVPRTAANFVTVCDDTNYNLNVGQMNEPARMVMDCVPSVLPF